MPGHHLTPGITLTGATLPGAQPPGADPPGAEPPGARFFGTQPPGAQLPGQMVLSAALPGAMFPGVMFPCSMLTGATLTSPVVSRPALSSAHGAVLSGALGPAARWVCRQIAAPPVDTGRAARAAREFTGQILRAWGLAVLAEDAAVIVSELATNAVRHGRRGRSGAVHDRIELVWWRRSGQVVCAVTDPGAEPPVLVQPDPFAEDGRGLLMVQALSSSWGWTRLGGRRKAVWAALRLPGAADNETGAGPA